MLNFFRHSYPQQLIFIVVTALVFWLPSFIMKTPVATSDATAPLYNIFVNIMDFSPFMIKIFAFLTFLFSTFFFNSVITINRLVTRHKTLASFCFLCVMCYAPELTTAYPFLFACPFILMAVHTIFLVYQTDNPELYMMNIGYFLAIASLFYFPAIFLILWVLISFVMMKYNKLRYLLIPVTSMAMIYIIFIGIAYLFGDIEAFLSPYLTFFERNNFTLELTSTNIIFLTALSLLFIISLFLIMTNRNAERANNVKKRMEVSMVLAIFSVVLLFIIQPSVYNTLILSVFSLFLSVALSEMKKTKIANIIMVIVMLSVAFVQYYALFS